MEKEDSVHQSIKGSTEMSEAFFRELSATSPGLVPGVLVGQAVFILLLVWKVWTLRRAQWFKLVSGTIDEAVVVHNGQKPVAFNEAFVKMTGTSPRELRRKKLSEIFITAEAREVGKGDEEETYAANVRKDDGRVCSVMVKETSVKTVSGKKFVLVLRDVSGGLGGSLRGADERARAFFNGTADPLLIVSSDRPPEVNTAFVALFGYRSQELSQGHPLDSILHQGYSDAAKRQLALARTENFRSKAITHDGRLIDIDVFPRKVIRQGETLLILTLRDISPLVRLESELAHRISLDGLIFNESCDGFFVVDKLGRVELSNSAFLRLWEVPDSVALLKDEISLTGHMLNHVVNSEEFISGIHQMIVNPNGSLDDVVLLQDGRRLRRVSFPHLRDGEFVCRVWRFYDTSPLDALQLEVSRNSAMVDAGLDASFDGLVILNAKGGVVRLNRRLAALWRLPESFPCDGSAGMAEIERREVFLHRTAGAPLEGASVEIIKMIDGRVIERVERSRNVEGSAESFRVISYRDLTIRTDAEDRLRHFNAELELFAKDRTSELELANRTLREANAELEAFSSSVSHDLRAPLRGIDGISLALEEEYSAMLDETGKDYLRRVRAGVQRMARIMDDLIHLSRVSRAELRHEPLDLAAMANSVVETLRKGDPERTVIFDSGAAAFAYGDRRMLRVVMENLLGNAWKYSSKRQAAVILFGFEEEANGFRKFFVRDNGAGFDPAYRHKLFQAFTRLHRPSEFEGTGIGLAIVARILRRHQGSISAEGEVGKGATFSFTLPVPPREMKSSGTDSEDPFLTSPS